MLAHEKRKERKLDIAKDEPSSEVHLSEKGAEQLAKVLKEVKKPTAAMKALMRDR